MSIADELFKIKELLDSGAIDNKEYEKLKGQLIEQGNNESPEIYVSSDYHIVVEKFILDNQPPTKYRDKDYSLSIQANIEKELKRWSKRNETFYHPYIVNNVDANNFENFEYPSEYIQNILDKNFTKLDKDENVNFLIMSPGYPSSDRTKGLIFTNKRLIYNLELLGGKWSQVSYSNDAIELINMEQLRLDESALGQSIPINLGDKFIGSVDKVGIKENGNDTLRNFLTIIYKSIKNIS